MSSPRFLDDMNSPDFDVDVYVKKLLKESSLETLMATESALKSETRRLDSEMQTLVYENYNKFIAATDTVRRMQHDFGSMEADMHALSHNMSQIMHSAARVTDALQERRDEIIKLSAADDMLKKLQFLFDLPTKLKTAVENKDYTQATDYYSEAQQVLRQCCHLPAEWLNQQRRESADCVQQLTVSLRAQLNDQQISVDEMCEAVTLLLRLGESSSELITCVLNNMSLQLEIAVTEMTPTDDAISETGDLLHFMDQLCNHFIVKLSSFIPCFSKMFRCNEKDSNVERGDDPSPPSSPSSPPSSPPPAEHAVTTTNTSCHGDQLQQFVAEQLRRLLQLVDSRLAVEAAATEPALVARALDKLHRRMTPLLDQLPNSLVSASYQQLLDTAVERRCQLRLEQLRSRLDRQLQLLRTKLAAAADDNCGSGVESGGAQLSELLAELVSALVEQFRSTVTSLQVFARADLSYSSSLFRHRVCHVLVRERVLVAFLQHVAAFSSDLCGGAASGGVSSGGVAKLTPPPPPAPPPTVLLLLCKMCGELETSVVQYLLEYADAQLQIDDTDDALTSYVTICDEMRATARLLIDCYVHTHSAHVSQMLRKSVETRDWRHSVEPRSVRSVMRRLLDQLVAVDEQLAQLLGHEPTTAAAAAAADRPANSYSDSSRRMMASAYMRSSLGGDWSNYSLGGATGRGVSLCDPSVVSVNIHKLFSERVELFAPVDFTRISVLTGIVKLALKTLLECVREQTFGRYGLQQMQVDTHYLQVNLWRFVSDEKLLRSLLDEVMGCVLQRCLEPVMMEFSVIESLADRL